MTLFVDTSVWSLALRRDRPPDAPEVDALARALQGAEQVVTTGLVLQELLQGFRGARAREKIVSRFGALPLVVPDRGDHVAAADLRTSCRRRGVQIGTIDALFAQLCIRHDLTMLTTDGDFTRVAAGHPLRLWLGRSAVLTSQPTFDSITPRRPSARRAAPSSGSDVGCQ